MSAPRSRLSISGDPAVYQKTAQSGRRRGQHFCSNCGSPLFSSDAEGGSARWGIRWGGMRQRRQLAPTRQIWRKSAAAWLCAFDDLPAILEE